MLNPIFLARGARPEATHVAASGALSRQQLAVARGSPAVREYLPREINPKIARARRAESHVRTGDGIGLYGSGQRSSVR